MRDSITDVLPKHGLFATYMKYTEGNELCPRFRFFSFAAAMGAVIRRKVSFQRSSYGLFPTLYPNLWIILVAPQGRGHKSASLSIARKLIQKLDQKHQPKILASKLTPEALIKALAAQSVSAEIMSSLDSTMISVLKKPAQGLLYSSELGVLLGKEKYNQGMIALLTDLYDTPNEWQSDTVMRGDQRLYDVCLSVMGASTPDWMQTMLPSDAFKGGFMSRMLLVGYPDTWYIRIADPAPADKNLEAELLAGLEKIVNTEGSMVWTDEAKKYFEDWYLKLEEPEPGPRAAYLERKQDQLLRLAMLLQMSWDTKLSLTKEAIEGALLILNEMEKDTLKMVDYISVEPRMRIVQRVLEIMEVRGVMTEGELLTETWRYLQNPREFQEVTQMLLKSNQMKMTFEGAEVIYQYLGRRKGQT